MPGSARLIDVEVPKQIQGVALLLHGGGSRTSDGRAVAVSPTQLSVLRMVPIGRAVVRAAERRLAVLRLINSSRGWDRAHSPVDDAHWALSELAGRFGSDCPVCLVGHSLGGRAALLCAGQPHVRGVVALAPWVYPTDPVTDITGTLVVIIHGDQDRIADPGRSHALAERLGRQTPTAFITVRGGTHAMLRRRDAFDHLAARCVSWMLLGRGDDPRIRRIEAGETELVI